MYRNPFDQICSVYNMRKKKKETKHLNKTIDYFIARYIKSYQIIKHFENQKNVKVIAYENLKQNTQKVFIEILEFFEIPINNDLSKIAIENASIKNVKKAESSKEKLRGDSFITSGKIGQWKQQLSKSQINLIKKECHKNNIDLADFILDE